MKKIAFWLRNEEPIVAVGVAAEFVVKVQEAIAGHANVGWRDVVLACVVVGSRQLVTRPSKVVAARD